MSELTVDLARNRRIGLRDAPSSTSFPAVEAAPQYREDAQKAPMLFTLVRIAAAILLVTLLVTYFIVAFCVDEYRSIWPRGA